MAEDRSGIESFPVSPEKRGSQRSAPGKCRGQASVAGRSGAVPVLRLLTPLLIVLFLVVFCAREAAAAPYFWAKGTFTSGIGALTVPVPTFYTDGDVFLLFVESANEVIATPSGWTQVTNSPQFTGTAAAAGGVRVAVFYKVVSGAQSSVSVADSGNHTTAIIAGFRGVDTSAPIHLTAGSVDAAATASLSAPGLTTTIAETLIVNAIGLDKDGADTNTLSAAANANLTAVTERHDETVLAGVGGGIAFITGAKASAGATGNTTATGNTATTHAYITIALKGLLPDFTLSPGDITFSPASAGFNENIQISAKVYKNSGPTIAGGATVGTPVGGLGNAAAQFTMLDLVNPITADGVITQWKVWFTSINSQARLRIFRDDGANYVYVGQSQLETPVPAVVNTYTTNIEVKAGDKVGVYWTTGNVYIGYYTAASGMMYINADQTATSLKTAWTAYAARMDLEVSGSTYTAGTVKFYDSDPDFGGAQIGAAQNVNILKDGSQTVSVNWSTVIEKNHNIYAQVDRENLVSESNESNNKASNIVLVSSAPDAVRNSGASAYSISAIDLNWYATGDDGYTGVLNDSTFIVQYTSVTAWAGGNSWNTNAAAVPGYVYTTEIATTGVAAGSQRYYRQNIVSSLSNTKYYFRLWTKDDIGRYSALSNGATASTLADPVTNSQIYKVFYSSVAVNWKPHPASPENLTCEGYELQASTASNFTGLVYSSVTYNVASTTLTMTSLGTNSTYYFQVASLNWYNEQNFVSAGSTCTLKPPPGSSPLEPEITGVYLSSMTMGWLQVGADGGYVVEASTALDFTGTLTSSETADGTLESLTAYEPALYANTTYYIRVGAIWGKTTSYAATQIAPTLATLANPIQWALFKDVYITSAAATWQGLPESPQIETCEGYTLDASTAPDWTGTVYSSATPSVLLTTLTVTGLSPNVTYYFRLGTLNWNASGNYMSLITTPTLAALPLDTAVIAASSYSITAQWSSGSPANPSGTNYVLEASSKNFDGTATVFPSATTNLQAAVTGLMPNTTYYVRPKALNWAGRSTYGTIASSATLANLVSGAQFYQTNITSVTVNWLQFPASPSSSTCLGYIVEASTASNFTGDIFSSATINGVVPSTLTVKNLYSDTWYYFRVGSYNWNFVPNYVSLGSQKTNIAVPPPDLMIMDSDIKFDPTAADFGWVVLTSATVRNLSYNFMDASIKQEVEFTSGYYVDTARPQGQGFVISQASPACLKSVEIKAWDTGTAGDLTTIKITTGTTSIPHIGNKGARVYAEKTITISGASTAWWTVTFDEMVCLPPLSAGDAYWIVAYNPALAANGDAWLYENSNAYTPAARATSADGGATWTTQVDEFVFRVNYSSCIQVSYYDGDPDSGGTFIGISTIPVIDTNQTRVSTISWTAASPEAYHNIYVHVDRVGNIIESDDSNNEAFNSIAISSAPDKVTGLTASTNSATAIDLKWYATGDDGFTGNLNNSTFTIQYTADAAWAQGNDWASGGIAPGYVYTVYIATTGEPAGSQRFYTQTGLSINTTYYFRLWTLDDFGRYSPISNGATVCTLAAQPAAPSQPFAGVYFSSVSVLWLANGNPDYTEYRLQASTASNFTGDLSGPYIGPTGWFTGVSSMAISLYGCTTYYFRAQARNQASLETDFQTLGSTKTNVYHDCGLRMQGSKGMVTIACQPTYCTGDKVSPLLMRKGGADWAIGLVDVADPKASGLEIRLKSGAIKAYRKY